MIEIVEPCERYFYEELQALMSRGFHFRSKELSSLLEVPFEKLSRNQRSTLIVYAFHLQCRMIPIGVKRKVIECSGIKCPVELETGYKQLKEELMNGLDLVPRLSKKMSEIDFSDGMLSDWGITHFHLGDKNKKISNNKAVERTGVIAYAYLTNDEAYIITIADHNKWSDNKLLDSLLREHPYLGEQFRVGCSLKEVADITPAIRDKLRREGVNAFSKAHNNVYLPLGGGVTCNGVMIGAALECNRLYKLMRELEVKINEKEREIYRSIKEQFGGANAISCKCKGIQKTDYGLVWLFELSPYDAMIVKDDWGIVLICGAGQAVVDYM